MRLLDAHVTHYRSIEDSEKFDIDPEVTCLVGKNEAGKTALLHALYRLNPVESVSPFDEDLDFPAKQSRQRQKYKRDQLVPVVTARFELTESEAAHVAAELGEKALKSPTFTLTKGYRKFPSGRWGFDYDENAIVEHLVAQLDPTSGEAVGAPDTVEELVEKLAEQEELPSAAIALLNKVKGWGGEGWRCVHTLVEPMLPRFVYFENYDAMPGKAAIPDLVKRRAEEKLKRGEIALLNLLALANADPEDFDETRSNERLIRRIENASVGISEEVFEYWTQNTGLSVKLDVKPPEDDAPAPLNQGTNLQGPGLQRAALCVRALR